MGTPVVATGTGGSAEYLRDGENCLLVEPGDADAVAAAVRRLAGDHELRQRLRAGGLETAAAHELSRFTEAIEAELEPSRPMSEPQVTIAVVSWNTRELLGRCLESMRAPVEAGLARVVVVDNASADGSAELVRERFEWAELIEAERNLGFGAAVNAAVARRDDPVAGPGQRRRRAAPGGTGGAARRRSRRTPRRACWRPRCSCPAARSSTPCTRSRRSSSRSPSTSGSAAAMPRLGDRLCLDGRWEPARARGDRLGTRRFPARAPRRLRGRRRLRRRAVDVRGGPRPRVAPGRGGVGATRSCPRRGWATRSRRQPANGSATTSGPRLTWRRPRTGCAGAAGGSPRRRTRRSTRSGRRCGCSPWCRWPGSAPGASPPGASSSGATCACTAPPSRS